MNATLAPVTLNRLKIKMKGRLHWTWEHLALSSILLLSAFLGLWNLSINGYSNSYYSSAVKSMLQSWSNFFYVSFDPGGFVTVDKPPVAFWVQAAFAKVFGFSGVNILIPEALAGVASVFLLYIMVKRVWGTGAGLVSSLLLALTPIWVLMNRDNNPDSILVFTLMLAAWAMLRAAEKGRLRWLLLSGVLVGVAFNVKMLEAYIVLPAFFLMYFLVAQTTWKKRIVHLVLATLVIAAVSLSWAVAVDLTPASQRPYVDSSSANSELDLILNYNGLSRVEGTTSNGGGGGTAPDISGGLSGQNSQSAETFAEMPVANQSTTDASATTTTGTSTTGEPPQGAGNFAPQQGTGNNGGGGGNFGTGETGITRLFVPQLAGEFNWFGPMALLGLIFLGISSRFGIAKGQERSRRLQFLMVWGGWLLLYGLVFSFSKGTFHSYYLNIMAPAVAALAGVGVVMMWKRFRQGGWLAWLLPITLAATAFYQAYILTGFTSWNEWLSPVLIVTGISCLVGFGLVRIVKSEKFGTALARGIVWTTMAALLVTPAAWSVRVVFTAVTGSIVSALPTGSGGMGNSNTSGNTQAWLEFIQNNLSGQLVMAAIITGIFLVIYTVRFFLRKSHKLNVAVLTGVLLAFFLVGSTGWWINSAEAGSNQAIVTTTGSSSDRGGPGNGGNGGSGGGMGSEQTDTKLVQYLLANQDGYKYLVAVSNSTSAAPIILATDQPVMSLGGFLGSVNIISSTAQLEEMIANHTIRYFLLGGNGGQGGQNSTVSTYVQKNCTLVDSSEYSSSSTTSGDSTAGTQQMGGSSNQQLYVCGS